MEHHHDMNVQNSKSFNSNSKNSISHDCEEPKENAMSGIIRTPGDEEISHPIHDDLKAFVNTGKHPCVGAAAAFNKDEYWLAAYPSLADRESSKTLARDLYKYLNEQKTNPKAFATFLAVFEDESSEWTENNFEEKLWKQLSMLDEISSVFFKWDESVSADPNDSKFSFSFGGSAFYVVGLHPNSSRMARSFKYPTLVFNLHSQFEELRQSGRYGRMRDTIRSRDEKLQGSINPMMRDFGSGSEARQYSGRAVDESWKCPFHAMSAKSGQDN